MNTTQQPQPGLEVRALVPESNTLTIMPLHLRKGSSSGVILSVLDSDQAIWIQALASRVVVFLEQDPLISQNAALHPRNKLVLSNCQGNLTKMLGGYL